MPAAKDTEEICRLKGTLFQGLERHGEKVYSPLGDEGEFFIALTRLIDRTNEAGTYALCVTLDGETALEQPLDSYTHLTYFRGTCSVHWTGMVDNAEEFFAFRFDDVLDANKKVTVAAAAAMDRFVALYNRCAYCILTGTGEVDPDDEWYQYLAGAGTSELRNETVEEAVFELDEGGRTSAALGAAGANVCFADSMVNHRTMVLRRNDNGADKGMVFRAVPFTTRGYEAANTEELQVSGVRTDMSHCLLDHAQNNVFLSGTNVDTIQQVDLVKGTIVQNYTPEENFGLRGLTYAAHTAARDDHLFTCLGRNVAFNVDTRMDPRHCIVSEGGKGWGDYALKTPGVNFTCHATSANGYLVIGDAKGNIRLYTGPPGSRKPAGGHFPKTAKTLLETKTPILAIDVSANGAYVVATCADHLLFLETKYMDGKGAETTGFEGRMGQQKPQPLLLAPTPQQVASMGGPSKAKFTRAMFDRFNDDNEECIFASCGETVLSWTLKSILRARSARRPVVQSLATLEGAAVDLGGNIADHVTYLTTEDVGSVPLQQATKKTQSAWTWGSK